MFLENGLVKEDREHTHNCGPFSVLLEPYRHACQNYVEEAYSPTQRTRLGFTYGVIVVFEFTDYISSSVKP